MALDFNPIGNRVVSPLATDTSTNTQKKAATDSIESPTKEMFLKLLVAQIKNQDPLNPTDGTQFLGQLAQFSELEQLIGIRENTTATAAAAAATTTADGTVQ